MNAGRPEPSRGTSFTFWGLKGRKASAKAADEAWEEQPDPKVDAVMGVPVCDRQVRRESFSAGMSGLSEGFAIPVLRQGNILHKMAVHVCHPKS